MLFVLSRERERRMAGKRAKLLNSAIKRVIETRSPRETVPPKLDATKIPKPKKRTIKV